MIQAPLNRRERRAQEREIRRRGGILVSPPSTQKVERPKIAFCVPFEEICFAKWVTKGLLPLTTWMSTTDVLHSTEGAFIDSARNELALRALESEAEYLFWLDSDNIPPAFDDTTVVDRLLAHQKDIVGGWYRVKKKRHPCVYDFVSTDTDKGWRNYMPRADAPEDPDAPACTCGRHHAQEVERVDGLGFGCMLIHRRVFEALGDGRWFTTAFGTEDLEFEYQARQKGFETHVDWGIHAQHLGVFAV